MKQTVEEVAREAAEDCYECHYDDSLEMRLVKEAFIYGAEWQSKQSPWISVKEGLPEKNTGVFFTVEWKDSRKGYFVGLYYGNGQWESDNRIFLQDSPLYRITHYMPIPSFDDILEANRDVLERKRERRLNMEVNNGIIIDGVLHELKETKRNDCLKCSLRDLCQNEFGNGCLCWINLASELEMTNNEFKCRGKVTNIKIDKEE
jgi:hypothetical protein